MKIINLIIATKCQQITIEYYFIFQALEYNSITKHSSSSSTYLFLIYLFELEVNYNIMAMFAIHRHESATVYMCSPLNAHPTSLLPPHLIPLGYSRTLALSDLLHALNLPWSSVLHMVIYRFQRYSLKSSHPCLLPHSPKVCSLHLCLFCYLAYRVLFTIFPNSIYMC